MAKISVSVEKYVVTIAAPSFILLKSFTVNGVIRLDRITPLVMPTAIGIIPSSTRAKIRRWNSIDREMISKISNTLEMATSGLPNEKCHTLDQRMSRQRFNDKIDAHRDDKQQNQIIFQIFSAKFLQLLHLSLSPTMRSHDVRDDCKFVHI